MITYGWYTVSMLKIYAMSRTEVISELAKYAHPTWYHQLLNWSTRQLQVLLEFYVTDK